MQRMSGFAILGFAFLTCFAPHDAALAFTKAECVLRETTQVDPPYRLSPSQASVRCTAIARRIDKLSKQILGKWHRMAPNGQTEVMEFLPDGTEHGLDYYYDTRDLRPVVRKWSFENPYGTLGQESLQIDNGTLTSVKFSGSIMTITSHAADIDVVDRWTRFRS